jgi:aromatic ring-opening dioxygenase catalytic subunit (LigB family)
VDRGVIAAAVVPHVPTLGLAENTPEFQLTLVEGERALGRALRNLEPDLFVVNSAHWICTFGWYATCQSMHEGMCVADEAPDLIPGIRYRRKGDSEFASALVEEWQAQNVPGGRNDTLHYAWDYGSLVPLLYLDPDAEVPVVQIPTVILADHAECMKAGLAVHATAKRLGRRVVFLASSAFSHDLVRGRHFKPTPEREALDRRFIDQLKKGALADAIAWFPEYSRAAAAEMNGKPLAAMLGALQGMSADGVKLAGEQFGGYAQSSGSGNANIAVWPQ